MGVGRMLSDGILETIHETITGNTNLDAPRITLLLVGEHPAAISYAEQTVAAAMLCRVSVSQKAMPGTSSSDDVLKEITSLNEDNSVHGIVLQLPIPTHLDTAKLIAAMADDKDVDGLKEGNLIRYAYEAEPPIMPCIALACKEVLDSLGVLPQSFALDQRVVILGLPSPIEIALELVLGSAGYEVRCCRDDMDASVTHHELKGADVLLVGRSQPGAVTANWVRDGCIILDLGLFSCAPPKRVEVCEKQRDVVALCCRDGLAAITAALRMRNASHCSLLNQGFLDVQKSTGFFEDTGDW